MLIFIDIETTGLEDLDRICSIGIIAVDDEKITSIYNLVNEGKKISPKASSINHITNEILKDKPSLIESEAYQFLQQHNNEDTTLISHNIKFDLKMLSPYNFIPMCNLIDTLRVTKHLIPECEEFSLQFLRYELRLYKEESKEALECDVDEVSAHNALSDALHVKMLYKYLLDMTSSSGMIELSTKNVLIQKFNFGKYNGQYIEDICMNDRGYLEWILLNIMDLDEDLRYSIEYYLEKV